MIFDSSQKLTLESINKYLETQGVNLSEQDKKQVASIFKESDNLDNKKGELNTFEAMNFSNLIEKVLPNIREKIDNFINELGLAFKPERRPIAEEKADATRVANPQKDLLTNVSNEKVRKENGAKFTRFSSKISTNSPITLKNPPHFDKEVFTQALNSLVKGNSKMKNMGNIFVNSSINDLFRKPLNPFIVVAIAMHESAGGVSKAALQKNNIGGIMGKNGLRKFEKVEQCIDSITSTVNKRVTEGYTSISKVGNSGRYCAKSVGPQWSAQVASFAEKLRAKYEELLKQKYDIK